MPKNRMQQNLRRWCCADSDQAQFICRQYRPQQAGASSAAFKWMEFQNDSTIQLMCNFHQRREDLSVNLAPRVPRSLRRAAEEQHDLTGIEAPLNSPTSFLLFRWCGDLNSFRRDVAHSDHIVLFHFALHQVNVRIGPLEQQPAVESPMRTINRLVAHLLR